MCGCTRMFVCEKVEREDDDCCFFAELELFGGHV